MWQSWVRVLLVSCALAACVGAQQQDDRLSRVGNSVLASASGVSVPGPIFLLHQTFAAEAVLFAYSAYFRNDKRVALQLWRPRVADSVDSGYRLVAQTNLTPAVVRAREDVYLEGKLQRCVRVYPGDRVGVHVLESPGSVAYVFNASNPLTLGVTVFDPTETSQVKLGQVVPFSTLRFPYLFSVSAWVDNDLSRYVNQGRSTSCPRDLNIPQDLPEGFPTVASPTGIPGAAGKQGPIGPQGPPGPPGPPGQVGPVGPVGPSGADGLSPKQSKSVDSLSLRDGPFHTLGFSIFLILWMIAITLAIVTLLALVICYRRRRNRSHSRSHLPATLQTSFDSTTLDRRPSWLNSMKDDTFQDYHIETIAQNGSRTVSSFAPTPPRV